VDVQKNFKKENEMTKTELIEKLKNNEKIEFTTKLKGSEKQIKWAESFREKWLPGRIEAIRKDFLLFGWDDEDMIEEMEEDLLTLLNTDDSSLIIAWETN